MERFSDRREAGRRLAEHLMHLKGEPMVVLALPRGGVPVGFEVANALGAPLDVFLVRKLGVPYREELAFGALASGGLRVTNNEVVTAARISQEAIEEVVAREAAELERREAAYRLEGERPDISGKTALVVDDGIATGATIKAASMALKEKAARVVIAVPVAPAQIADELRGVADAFFSVLLPNDLRAIGLWYRDFSQTSDAEVRELLAAASTRAADR